MGNAIVLQTALQHHGVVELTETITRDLMQNKLRDLRYTKMIEQSKHVKRDTR